MYLARCLTWTKWRFVRNGTLQAASSSRGGAVPACRLPGWTLYCASPSSLACTRCPSLLQARGRQLTTACRQPRCCASRLSQVCQRRRGPSSCPPCGLAARSVLCAHLQACMQRALSSCARQLCRRCRRQRQPAARVTRPGDWAGAWLLQGHPKTQVWCGWTHQLGCRGGAGPSTAPKPWPALAWQ